MNINTFRGEFWNCTPSGIYESVLSVSEMIGNVRDQWRNCSCTKWRRHVARALRRPAVSPWGGGGGSCNIILLLTRSTGCVSGLSSNNGTAYFLWQTYEYIYMHTRTSASVTAVATHNGRLMNETYAKSRNGDYHRSLCHYKNLLFVVSRWTKKRKKKKQTEGFYVRLQRNFNWRNGIEKHWFGSIK
jgi:hypothetical protein